MEEHEEPEKPEGFDDEENREAENPDPNAGPSVAGLLLIGFGFAFFFGLPLKNKWMDTWAILLLNWPIAGAMLGGGLRMLAGKPRQGATESGRRRNLHHRSLPAQRPPQSNGPQISNHPHELETSMSERSLSIDGVRVPRFLYGTAWKEDETRRLVELALQQGFRGIDTANQRRHYHEAAVGQAIAASIESGLVTRDDLFLQTKFTSRPGQDHRLPYDPAAPIAMQVAQSFASSLEHLGTERIDSYVLHGPSQRNGLGPADWEAWRAMEAIHDSGRARLLGVSNVSLEQLQTLFQKARIRPKFVQNRCYAVLGWDHGVRNFCAANELIYQGFSLLTANRDATADPEFARIAKRHDRTVSQIVFRFALDVGMIPLTGSTNADHLRTDLDVFDFHLDPEEIERIERVAAS